MKNRTFFQEYHYNEDFWYINTAPKNSLLDIELMGITYADTSYRVSRNNRWDMYILEYVIDGVGHITCNGTTRTVRKGDAYLISKFTEHEYHADPKHPYKKVWINVSGRLMDQLLQLFNLTDPTVTRQVDLLDYFYQLRDQLALEYDLEKIGSILYRILYKMSENFNPVQKQTLSLAERLKIYIDKNLKQNLSAASVAQQFHVTPIYASRVFKSTYQLTINQYIMNATLELAKQWLKNSNYTIKEIAELLNFCNDKYFSTQFKKIYGFSPKQYQLMHRKKTSCNTPSESESELESEV